MRKTVLCIVLSLMLTMSCALFVSAAGQESLKLSVQDISAEREKEFDVTVSITENTGFIGLNLYLVYPEELTFVKATNSASDLVLTQGKTLVFDGAKDYTQTGNLLTLTFTLSADAILGESYEIQLMCTEAFNEADHDLNVQLSSGSVTVLCTHNYGSWISEVPATCTASGTKGYWYCPDCERYFSDKECQLQITGSIDEWKVSSKLGHDFSEEWTIDKPATFTEEGIKSHHCTRCEAKADETPIPKLTSKLSVYNTPFDTAWGLDFVTEIKGSQLAGAGGAFTLVFDESAVGLKKVEVTEGVTAVTDDGKITINVDHEISEDETLVTLTFTTSDELASGTYTFITLDGEIHESAFTELTIYEMGDVNMDGKVNSRDVTLIKQYSVKIITLSDPQKVYANVYVDENVNSRDAVLITQQVVHMDVTLGDRVNVTFEEETGETERTVHKGEDIQYVPETPEGYEWSESETVLIVPDFKAISEDKRYYLWKKEN